MPAHHNDNYVILGIIVIQKKKKKIRRMYVSDLYLPKKSKLFYYLSESDGIMGITQKKMIETALYHIAVDLGLALRVVTMSYC